MPSGFQRPGLSRVTRASSHQLVGASCIQLLPTSHSVILLCNLKPALMGLFTSMLQIKKCFSRGPVVDIYHQNTPILPYSLKVLLIFPNSILTRYKVISIV